MRLEWIMGVLTDLQSFARDNGLPSLAAELDDARQVAEIELAARAEGCGVGVFGQSAEVRKLNRTAGIQ